MLDEPGGGGADTLILGAGETHSCQVCQNILSEMRGDNLLPKYFMLS